MAIQPCHVQYAWSHLREEDVEISRLYDDGFLYLKGDPQFWIQSNPDSVSSVRSLELEFLGDEGEKIGDSIRKLSQLTELSILGGKYLKFLPNNTLSRLHNLQLLRFYNCEKLQELPADLGELYNLDCLRLDNCPLLKPVPNSVITKLPSNLTNLFIMSCHKMEELPTNFGELYNLTYLSLSNCPLLEKLPANFGDLFNLKDLYLNSCPLLEKLPANFGDLFKLTSLTLKYCPLLKSVPNSATNLSKLTELYICHCDKLEELPANLGDLKFLTYLNLEGCDSLKYLPWSINKLSKLRILNLPKEFRVETLPPHLNSTIIISFDKTHIRKTWEELKTHMKETLSFQFPIIPGELVENLPLKTSTPGYLQLMIGDLTPWIRNNNDLRSSIRILDLDLLTDRQFDIPASIDEVLPQLTHFYISNGNLPHHLPQTFIRLTHLSLIGYTFECHTESHFDSLGNLSTLTSLHLSPLEKFSGFPKEMDLPLSLRHLSLSGYSGPIPDSYVTISEKLSNFNTLTLSCCASLGSLLLQLKLTKLIIKSCSINSIPIGLKHLEIIHDMECCNDRKCTELQECWRNQLVNLETLSCTCYAIKSLSSVTSLHNLRELQLKDCFNLRELPPDLDKLVNLYTLDVSGTRIHSLPDRIINLHNLQHLALPKCFIPKRFPCDFENKVTISVDDTDQRYYIHAGYYNSVYELSDDEDSIYSNSTEDDTEIVAESRQEAIIEQASPHRPLDHLPVEMQILEDPTSNNNPNAFNSSPNHEIENLPISNEAGTRPVVVNEYCSDVNPNTMQDHDPMDIEGNNNAVLQYNNRDGVVTDIAAEPSSNNLDETNSLGLSNQQVERIDNTLELEQGNSSCGRRGSLKGQDNIAQRGGVQYKTQKKRHTITSERIHELKSRDLTLEVAAKHLGVSRSTLKRRLKELGITWSSKEEGMNPDTDTNETHSTCERNLSQPNSIDASNPASHGQGVEHIAGSSQPTLSYHVPSEHNVVNHSTPDVVSISNEARTRPVVVNEYCSEVNANTMQDHDPMDIEVRENNSHAHAIFGSRNQETEILKSNNWDVVMTTFVSDIPAEPSFNLQETNSFGENNQQCFQNEHQIVQGMELEQDLGERWLQYLLDDDLFQSDHAQPVSDPTTNNNPNASITSLNHEIENLLTSNEAGTIPVVVNECHSDVNANKVQDHDPIDIADYLLSEGNNAVGLNNSHAHAILGSQNQETQILQSNNCDNLMTSFSDIGAEPSFSLPENNSFGENNRQYFQNENQIYQSLELQQGTSSLYSLNGQALSFGLKPLWHFNC